MSAELGSRGEEEPLPAQDQAEGPRMGSLAFENFPHGGTAVSMRPVIFGPATDEVALLITVSPQEGALRVVLGNGPINEEAPEGVIELMTMVIEMLQDPGFVEQWAAELNRLREQEESDETEPTPVQDLLDDDTQEG